MDDTPPHDDEEDDYDVLSALDFSTPDDADASRPTSDLDALDSYVVEDAGDRRAADAGCRPTDELDDELPVPLSR